MKRERWRERKKTTCLCYVHVHVLALQLDTTLHPESHLFRRAGLSASYKANGCDAWFLDIDREAVAPSFAVKPSYHESTGLVQCKNGLKESRFIHLDFLDFAMAVIKGAVNVGDLHAIHDGLDCSTFTIMAKSINQRHPGNAWCGITKQVHSQPSAPSEFGRALQLNCCHCLAGV